MLRDGIDIGRDIAANDRRPELALASIRNRMLDADDLGGGRASRERVNR